MQKLFLVRSIVSARHYMRDGQDVREEIDLVMARDAAEAESKVMDHYESQSESYSTNYSCNVVSVKETIV